MPLGFKKIIIFFFAYERKMLYTRQLEGPCYEANISRAVDLNRFCQLRSTYRIGIILLRGLERVKE